MNTQPAVKRTLIFSATGRNAPRVVSEEMARLETAYLKVFKRKLPPEVLTLSDWGYPPCVTMGITARTTDDQFPTLQFLRGNVSISPALTK